MVCNKIDKQVNIRPTGALKIEGGTQTSMQINHASGHASTDANEVEVDYANK